MPNPPSELHTTVVLNRRLRPGQEDAFRAWIQGFDAAMAAFPGFVSGQVVPPVQGAQEDWVFLYAFDTPLNLRTWLESDTRREWLAKAENMVASQGPLQLVSGLEQLFGLLSPSVAPPPPVWKVATSVLVGLYPVTLLNMYYLTPLLKPLPLPLRALVSTGIMVILMTWVVMPAVTRLLKPWLYPTLKSHGARSK